MLRNGLFSSKFCSLRRICPPLPHPNRQDVRRFLHPSPNWEDPGAAKKLPSSSTGGAILPKVLTTHTTQKKGEIPPFIQKIKLIPTPNAKQSGTGNPGKAESTRKHRFSFMVDYPTSPNTVFRLRGGDYHSLRREECGRFFRQDFQVP